MARLTPSTTTTSTTAIRFILIKFLSNVFAHYRRKGICSNVYAASQRFVYHTAPGMTNQAHPSIGSPRGRNGHDGRPAGVPFLLFRDRHDFIILESDDLVSGRFAPIAHHLL